MARQAEITPELLRIMEDTVTRAAELAEDDCYMAHLYAMFLLAQFREVRAYPAVVRFASLPSGPLESLSGDFITSNLGSVLASVCGGDTAGIKSLIESEDTDEWVRGAAVGSLLTLVAAGQKGHEETVSYFADLFRGKLARQHSNVWDELASASADICAAELIGDIERAYVEDLIDPGFVGLKEIRRDFAKGREWALAKLAKDPHRQMVRNTVHEMEWWATFRQEPPEPAPVQAQAAEKKPKVGRNEPCPCSSGKKFKKCCGG